MLWICLSLSIDFFLDAIIPKSTVDSSHPEVFKWRGVFKLYEGQTLFSKYRSYVMDPQ